MSKYLNSKTRWKFGTTMLVTLLVCHWGCSSSKESEGDLPPSNGNAGVVNNAGKNNAGKNSAGKNNAGKNSANGSRQSANAKNGRNGYDNNWNNIRRANQQAVAKNNKNQGAPNQGVNNAANNAPLVNNQSQQASQVNNYANQPAQQVQPANEPPLDAAPAPVANLPAPIANQAAPINTSVAVAPPIPAPAAPQPKVVPAIKPDLLPETAILNWVGYNFLEKEKAIRLEMVTEGRPKFDVFEEQNRSGQAELVVRFSNTKLRSKIRRDMNASEFRSPVAYVRMRPNTVHSFVDVVLTMRDPVKPRLFSQNGNVMLTFAIPERYLSPDREGQMPVAKAEPIGPGQLMPDIEAGSDMPLGQKAPKPFVNNPGADAFPNAPQDGGPVVNPAPVAPVQAEMIPADFGPEEPAVPAAPAAPQNAPGKISRLDPALNGASPSQNAKSNQFNNAPMPPAPSDGAGQVPVVDEPLPPPAGVNDGMNGGMNGGSPAVPAVQDVEDVDDIQENREELDKDSLDDFDDGEGESQSDIDKFDVRLKSHKGSDGLAFRVKPLAIASVAQDDLQQNQAAANGANSQGQGSENNFSNVPANNATANTQNASQGSQGNTGTVSNFQGANANQQNIPQNTPQNIPPPVNAAPPVNMTAPPMQSVPGPIEPVADIPPPPVPESGIALSGPETEGSENAQGSGQASLGGKPVKLEFREAPIRDVIRALGDETGINFIIADSVQNKNISMNLNGVPFNDALRAILATNQLGMIEIGPNVIRIDTLAEITREKSEAQTRRKSDRALVPTKILVHRLSYSKAKDAAPLLAAMLGGIGEGDTRIKLQTDDRTNSIIVNAAPNDLAMVKALIERIDLETPQVKISTRIVEVLKKFSNSFGISWGGPISIDGGRGLGFGSLPFPNNIASRYSIDAGGLTNTAGNLQAHIGSVSDAMSLDLALSMEETRGTTEILQSSNVVVENNKEALIVAGSSDTFRPIAAGNGTATAALTVNYNLEVRVTPQVTADGRVGLDVNITNNAPSTSSTGGIGSTNRSMRTTLVKKSGETGVIGGMYNTTSSKNQTGVPILSSLPIIGALFRSSVNNDEKRELLVMITPTVISTADGGQEKLGDMALNQAQTANAGSNDGNATSVSNSQSNLNQQSSGGGNEE